MDWTAYIPTAALIVSVISLLIASSRNARGDTRAAASAQARTEMQLNAISAGVEDIRVDIRTMRDKMEDYGQRLAAVESSAKSAHHRLDQLESKIK